jgi:hypothetical protein
LRLPASEASCELKLKAREHDKTIETSRSLVLQGSGWVTAEDAQCHGRIYADILARTCARLGMGADFGERTSAKSWFTKAGLDALSRQAGKPVLNDIHGLMVYDQAGHPSLLFSVLRAEAVVGVSLEQFLTVFNAALSRPRDLSDEERAAVVMFNASFFPDSADGRFMLLIMAAEAVFLEQQLQSDAVVETVRKLKLLVKDAALEADEKQKLMSRLGQLCLESKRDAGARTITEKLGTRKYNGMPAAEFFDRCYDLRGRLAHGDVPLPTLQEINGVVAELERLVSELLSTDLLDVGPQR